VPSSRRPKIVDYPAPKTTNPQAAAEYLAALHAMRDGSPWRAFEKLDRALVLDATLAQAHLRAALWTLGGDPQGARRHFASAMTARERLSERDRALLDALQSCMMADQLSPECFAPAARKLLARSDGDAELSSTVGNIFFVAAGLFDESADACRKALEVDPGDVPAAAGLAWANAYLGRSAEADLARCLDRNPGAAGCLMLRADIRRNLGDCAGLVLSAPIEHTRAHLWLGEALEATGDRAGACAAYARVVERWGKHGRRSQTLARSRQRMAALRCP
jgi:tetratricopeptide (TPR) repeat protein